MLQPHEILAQLVAIPSVNPMGRPLSGPEYLEGRVTDYLQAFFSRLGLPWHRQTVSPGRDNIFARLDAKSGGRLVVLEAHQDTVPVEGMTIDPWDPVVREGKLYGRGACDVKGGMAAMLAALARLAAERPAGLANLVVAATVNEEHGFSGADALCGMLKAGGDFLPRKPDAVVVAEPTELSVVVAHKGNLRWRCSTSGRAAHSSQPSAGENAIYRMAPLLQALDEYNREVLGRLPAHPLCGQATLSVGLISGGISVNTVPDRCTIEIDRRLLPGEDPAAAYQHAIEFLAGRVRQSGLAHDPPFMTAAGLADEHNGELGQRLAGAVREVRGRASVIGVPFGTNASLYGAAGCPSVVFGPGSIEQAHTADEWIRLAEVDQASEILYRFCAAGG